MHQLDTFLERALQIHETDDAPAIRLRTWVVQAATSGGVIHGQIQSLHHRLSDHLRETGTMIEIRKAVVLPTGARTPAARRATCLVSLSDLLFIVDLSNDAPTSSVAYVPREVTPVMLNIGCFWMSGNAHLPLGIETIQGFASGATDHFMAITDAVVHRQEALPQTYLVNREHLGVMVVERT